MISENFSCCMQTVLMYPGNCHPEGWKSLQSHSAFWKKSVAAVLLNICVEGDCPLWRSEKQDYLKKGGWRAGMVILQQQCMFESDFLIPVLGSLSHQLFLQHWKSQDFAWSSALSGWWIFSLIWSFSKKTRMRLTQRLRDIQADDGVA